jgi:hypothetical protein
MKYVVNNPTYLKRALAAIGRLRHALQGTATSDPDLIRYRKIISAGWGESWDLFDHLSELEIDIEYILKNMETKDLDLKKLDNKLSIVISMLKPFQDSNNFDYQHEVRQITEDVYRLQDRVREDMRAIDE